MDIVAFLESFRLFDLLVIFICMVAFIIGFVQGTVRRLLGIASITFSFLLATNLRDSLGGFFAEHWHQFPREYSYMIAFGFVFAVATIALSLLIQSSYERLPLFAKAPFVDEVLGGTLGVIQALLIMGFVFIILDSYFRSPGFAEGPAELPFIRSLWDSFDASGTANLFRNVLIPGFYAVIGGLIPASIRSLY